MTGWKTYALSALAVGVAVAEFLGIDVVSSIDQETALNAIWAALVAAAVRHGVGTGTPS
jgi:threonine/homoserine efflux transporter RhtA